jgi:hypothetical protein
MQEVFPSCFESSTNWSLGEGGDKSSLEMLVVLNSEAKGSLRIGGKEKCQGVESSERRSRNIEVRIVELNVNKIHRVISTRVEESGIEGTLGKRNIEHGFIKDSMLSSLDDVGLQIAIENVLGSAGKTKKDSSTSIRESLVRSLGASRKSIDSAAKSAEIGQQRFNATTDFERTLGIISMNNDIVESKMVIESVGPTFCSQTSTTKHRTKSITDGLMRTFARSILIGRVGGRRFYMISGILEEFHNFRRVTKFTAKIETNVAIRNTTGGGVLSKPTVDKVSRGALVRNVSP